LTSVSCQVIRPRESIVEHINPDAVALVWHEF